MAIDLLTSRDASASLSSFEAENDHDLSMSGTNVSTPSNVSQVDRLEQEWSKAASRDNVYVNLGRFAVFCTPVVAASVASLYVYDYIRDDQADGFEASFHANADQIIEKFHSSIKLRLKAVDALSLSITSYVKSQANMSWPLVTIPDYEIRAANARVLATTYMINFFVAVEEPQREAWNAYVNRTVMSRYFESFTSDSFQRQALDDRLWIGSGSEERRLQQEEIVINPLEETEDQMHFVAWKESPVAGDPRSLVNFDGMASRFRGEFQTILATGQAVLGPAFVLSPGNPFADYITYLYSLSQYHDQIEDIAYDPTSSIIYPVFDDFMQDTRQVVGALSSNVNWRIIFRDVLVSNVKGYYCVLENTFNQTYTIRVDGKEAVFVGEGDFHDPSYHHLVQIYDVSEYLRSIESLRTKSYTSVDLNADFCSFTLKVYPSSATEDGFRNRDPALIAWMIVSVFIFTSLIFMVYDAVVGRRLRYVMRRAVTSSVIVSSLFPSQVRAQLYEEKEQKLSQKRQNHDKDAAMDAMLKKLGGKEEDLLVDEENKARPIAMELNHSPQDVFELLETLYGKFDANAKRRRVFKVETIGDCYLAVTGLPHPQQAHAVICAKFANECIHHTNSITRNLSDRLGEDTMNLELRVGLHTGLVTAVVSFINGLNAEKTNIAQGDSVNTASRMETNGLPGRVHLSETTANELKARGKGAWLQTREDKVTVKGKGVMLTYWLNIPHSTETSSSGLSVRSDEMSDNNNENLDLVSI